MIRRRAATSIQTKIGKNGGIYHIRRLWPLAEAAGIGIMPGNHPITSVSAAATAHLCAAWSGPCAMVAVDGWTRGKRESQADGMPHGLRLEDALDASGGFYACLPLQFHC